MEIESCITSVKQVHESPRERAPIYNSIRIDSLNKVLETEPFVKNVRRSIVTDLDGAVCTKESVGDYPRIKTLAEIAAGASDGFAIYSARYYLAEGGFLEKILKPILKRKGQAVINYPFFDKESGDSLEKFIRACNPNCSANLIIGGEKLRRCNSAIINMASRALSTDGVFVFIGSGLIDKRNVNEIARAMDLEGRDTRGIYYLYTGKGLI